MPEPVDPKEACSLPGRVERAEGLFLEGKRSREADLERDQR
ncbi:MAG: hypothetical protein ACE5FQ_01295 [Thiogranum sp.]